jgi:hypothetical protein
MAGMATFGVLSSISLWRLGWIAPNSRFSAVLFGVPLLAFYTATVTMVLRLRRKMKHGLQSPSKTIGSSIRGSIV